MFFVTLFLAISSRLLQMSADKMSASDTLAQLKRNVRALLLSSKIGLTPSDLERDHMSILGYPLPLKQLGFENVMAMVEVMPDVVSVHTRPNGMIYLKGFVCHFVLKYCLLIHLK